MGKREPGKYAWKRQIKCGRKALQRQWEAIESIRNILAGVLAANTNVLADDDENGVTEQERIQALEFVLSVSQRVDRLATKASELESVFSELWEIDAQIPQESSDGDDEIP